MFFESKQGTILPADAEPPQYSLYSTTIHKKKQPLFRQNNEQFCRHIAQKSAVRAHFENNLPSFGK